VAETDSTGDHKGTPDGQDLDLSPERVFARRMKRERLRRGLRQEDLADLLAHMGLELHPSAIAKIEREPDPEKNIEPRMIRLNEAKVIAFVLRLTLDRMLSDDDLKNPDTEIKELEQHLSAATAVRERAHQDLMHAEAAVRQLHSRITAVREAAIAEKTVTPDLIFGGLKHSKGFYEAAEAFIAHWFKVNRQMLTEQGWGADGRGEPNDPNQLLGQALVIGQIFPDLAQVSDELVAKLKKDLEWWTSTGMRLHDEHLRMLVSAKMFRDSPGTALEQTSERTTPRTAQRKRRSSAAVQERLAEKLGIPLTSTPETRPPLEISLGDYVAHDRWGLGRVVSIEGKGARQQVNVDFGGQTMWILTRQAPMKKVQSTDLM
jgi:transcriptional regulator with XRE-family HTH domain